MNYMTSIANTLNNGRVLRKELNYSRHRICTVRFGRRIFVMYINHTTSVV